MMINPIKAIFKRKQKNIPESIETRVELESQIVKLQMQLEEQEVIISNLKKLSNKVQQQHQQLLTENSVSINESYLILLAPSLSQLLTQLYIHEKHEKEIDINDIFTVIKRIVHTLKQRGLQINGKVGELIPFDPHEHVPLSGDRTIHPGEMVVVRFVGFAYENRTIHKAGVEFVGDLV